MGSARSEEHESGSRVAAGAPPALGGAAHPILGLQRAAGNRAVQQLLQARGRGPRPGGGEDVPYRGPGASVVSQRRVGTSNDMGCVFEPLAVNTSGALVGGYDVNDYLAGGMSWGPVTGPGTAGRDGHGFKVQQHATFSNAESLGVTQTLTHGGSNQAFLDGTAAYLGMSAGSVVNGATFSEPVLDAGNPYSRSTGWNLQFGPKTGSAGQNVVSFVDVPRAGPGEKGYIDFKTTFYSRGGPCQSALATRTWRWTIDFTGTNDVNTVT